MLGGKATNPCSTIHTASKVPLKTNIFKTMVSVGVSDIMGLGLLMCIFHCFPQTHEEPELQQTFKYLKAAYEWQVKARWDRRIRHGKDVSLDHSFLGTSCACLPIGPHAD